MILSDIFSQNYFTFFLRDFGRQSKQLIHNKKKGEERMKGVEEERDRANKKKLKTPVILKVK